VDYGEAKTKESNSLDNSTSWEELGLLSGLKSLERQHDQQQDTMLLDSCLIPQHTQWQDSCPPDATSRSPLRTYSKETMTDSLPSVKNIETQTDPGPNQISNAAPQNANSGQLRPETSRPYHFKDTTNLESSAPPAASLHSRLLCKRKV
jgi:hypothetical protein